MKTNYLILAILTLLCGLSTSCSDFLEEDTRGLLSPDNYFQNEAEAKLALNGLQGQMTNPSELSVHLGTDLAVYGRNVASASMYTGIYTFDADNNSVANYWTFAYAGVRDANFLLSGIGKSSLSEEVKGSTRAQALFYRAMFYWNLTTSFGDVPYWRDEINMDVVSLLGKTDAKVIQAEMIADLEEAISSGYLATVRWNQNDSRPTVWAARMLKAYYHIWQKQWSEARTELIEITTNSPHGTELGPYADLYREGNERHNELIFGMENLAVSGRAYSNNSHNNAHYNSAGENANTRNAMTSLDIWQSTAGMTLRKSFADTYADTDSRKRYNVWDSHSFTNAAGNTVVAKFNWIYLPKLMRASVPLSDPLMKTPDIANWSSEPYKIFRLSDAFLLLAETEFMVDGSSPAALAAINKVRVRSNLPKLTTLTIQDIRNERAWELAGEGFTGRKKDLIRWGILESTVLSIPAAEKAAGAYSLAITRAQEEADIISNAPKGKFHVFPIPLDEVLKSKDIGGALVQNPLWGSE